MDNPHAAWTATFKVRELDPSEIPYFRLKEENKPCASWGRVALIGRADNYYFSRSFLPSNPDLVNLGGGHVVDLGSPPRAPDGRCFELTYHSLMSGDVSQAAHHCGIPLHPFSAVLAIDPGHASAWVEAFLLADRRCAGWQQQRSFLDRLWGDARQPTAAERMELQHALTAVFRNLAAH